MRRAGRLALWAALLVTILLVLGLGAGGWYYADQLLPALRAEDPVYDLSVLAADGPEVTIESGDDAATPGVFGLRTADGYGQVTEILAEDERSVTRRYRPIEGEPPATGDEATTSAYAFPDDPQRAHGIAYDEAVVPGELGDYPAWLVPGQRDTWAIFVHGRGATRAEALRLLPTAVAAGYPSLVVTYRNDDGAPDDPQGFGHYGSTEWRDLDAAVTWARGQGAAKVVLVGYSQGGSLVASFLRFSDQADVAVAAILDAPLLSMQAVLELEAGKRGIPDLVIPPLLTVTKAIAAIRTELPFDRLEHAADARELGVPILLFHGSGDQTVPISGSDTLAAALPDLVTYERYDDVGHVRAWNADPDRYETAAKRFLDLTAG